MKKLLFAPMLLASIFAIAQKNEDAAKFAETITGKAMKDNMLFLLLIIFLDEWDRIDDELCSCS